MKGGTTNDWSVSSTRSWHINLKSSTRLVVSLSKFIALNLGRSIAFSLSEKAVQRRLLATWQLVALHVPSMIILVFMAISRL